MNLRVGIIGGGIAGLVAGYELSKVGARVTILEREQRLGGLASSFALTPQAEVERYYHFICKPDRAYLDMIHGLGLASRLRWRTTKMGLFYNGGMHTIGDPLSLFRFPHFSFGDKLRFVWSTATVKFSSSKSWKPLENISAEQWLVQCYGRRAYDILYASLLNLKFRAHASRISAAWMWARFHRLGNSRTITQKECLGYLEGGTQLFISVLEQVLHRQGAAVYTDATVERVVVDDGRVIGMQCNGEYLSFDCVLSTVPVPKFLELVASADGPYFDNLRRLEYIDVLVMVLRLRHFFQPIFLDEHQRPADRPGGNHRVH